MQRWYLMRGGQVYGPYPLANMQQMVRQGQIVTDDSVCAEGSQTWVRAADQPALFPPVAVPVPVLVPAPAPVESDPPFETDPDEPDGVHRSYSYKPRFFGQLFLNTFLIGSILLCLYLAAVKAPIKMPFRGAVDKNLLEPGTARYAFLGWAALAGLWVGAFGLPALIRALGNRKVKITTAALDHSDTYGKAGVVPWSKVTRACSWPTRAGAWCSRATPTSAAGASTTWPWARSAPRPWRARSCCWAWPIRSSSP